jgi:hypothetical protein
MWHLESTSGTLYPSFEPLAQLKAKGDVACATSNLGSSVCN